MPVRGIQNRRQGKRRVVPKLILVVLLIILFFLLKGTWGIYQKAQLSKKALERIETEHAELQDRHTTIERHLDRLHTQTGQEEEIRSKYNVAKNGEQVVVIVDNKDEIVVEEEENSSIQSFFERLLFWRD